MVTFLLHFFFEQFHTSGYTSLNMLEQKGSWHYQVVKFVQFHKVERFLYHLAKVRFLTKQKKKIYSISQALTKALLVKELIHIKLAR